MRAWIKKSIETINADHQRSADTHLIKFDLPCFDDISLYLKDESTHPTGSLKHRLARFIFVRSVQRKNKAGYHGGRGFVREYRSV